MKVIEIQQALIAHGFNPGSLDGIWGRQTQAALRAFQSKVGLEPDGVVGAVTLSILAPDAPATNAMDRPELLWFKEARRLLGTREEPGEPSNSKILDWASSQGIPYRDDDIPWCGLFVAHCIGSTLDRERLPTNVLGARAWERFGVKTAPTPGAILVFWRKSLQSGLGHVGFYAGEDDDAYRVLGGNQSDSVSLAWIGKDRLLDARWPSTVAMSLIPPVIVSRNESLSWNES